MRALNEKHAYDLSQLSSEGLYKIFTWLKNNDKDWADCTFEEMIRYQKKYRLVSNTYSWYWSDIIEPTANAKELFYTLENIQVDCRELTQEEVNNIIDIYELNDIKFAKRDFKGTNTSYSLIMSFNNIPNEYTTITYEKFMELFSNKEENFKKLVESLNEELTEEAYKETDRERINLEFNPQSEHKLYEAYKETEYEVKYIAEKPKQYQIGIDTFERCEANMTKEEILACVRFNIDKYTWRNKGQDLEDLEKIISYANWAIKQLKK